MKNKQNSWSGGTKVVLLTLVILASQVQCNLKCLVDQCKVCKNATSYACQECESGYYLRNFYGNEKNKKYNDCWSYKKFWWALLATLLALLSYCLCCYLCYKSGIRKGRLRSSAQNKNVKEVRPPPPRKEVVDTDRSSDSR